nr:glutamate synthase central domain-containing protein [Paenibacillus larvae]
MERLAEEAVQLVSGGTSLLILDDSESHQNDNLWLDPHLAVSKLDIALRSQKLAFGDNLRRHVSLVLRSAAVRNLHDIIVACGLGVDAVSPYLLFVTASAEEGPVQPIKYTRP